MMEEALWRRLHRWARRGEGRPAGVAPGDAALKEARHLLQLTSDAMPEGFAICRAVRDRAGDVTAFRVEQINATLLRMLGYDQSPIGREVDDVLPPAPFNWFCACHDILEGGRQVSVDCKDLFGRGAYEVRLARGGPDKLTLMIIDRTQTWLDERQHAERLLELNHRMKNNLANVAALLRLQGARASDPAVREQLSKAANRVDAVSDAHACLYRFGENETVDLGAYLADLCERLGRALMEEGRVTLEVDAASIRGPSDRALPLGIIVNELVTNAAKYAYPGAAQGKVRVSLRPTSEGMSLIVADDGRGLPADLANKPGGLGMPLVRSLVRQLGGSLQIQRRAPGVAFDVRLPNAAAQGGYGREALARPPSPRPA